ncbi:MAG: peptidylprolyl isomerase [Marinicellaceae bacterium]
MKISLLLIFFVVNCLACEDIEVYPDMMFPQVEITTSLGKIVVELDRNKAPITVNNFLKYIKAKLYIGSLFHRVEENFVIQGGGYDKDMNEITDCGKIYNESGNGLKNKYGTIAMARYSDPHSATSQFYFNLTDSSNLDPNPKNWGYTVFGQVTEGFEVLDELAKVKVGYSDKLQSENVPIEAIFIESVIIN